MKTIYIAPVTEIIIAQNYGDLMRISNNQVGNSPTANNESNGLQENLEYEDLVGDSDWKW